MKIYTHGLGLSGGVLLRDEVIDKLAERHHSEKRVYFGVSFVGEHRERADSFLIPSDDRLDWILEDTEVLERNQYNDLDYTDLCQRALATLERGELLCESGELSAEESRYLRGLNVATSRPGRTCDVAPDEDMLHRLIHEMHTESGRVFFYTAGKPETRSWDVPAGATAPQAAGRIHSDLERGFIRAEVYSSNDLDRFATPQEAKSAGLLRLVDRTYVIAAGDVIDVKFNV